MSRIKVAVLRGGISPAYEESLKTGGYVLSLLRDLPEQYEPVDVFISRAGDWHRSGLVEDPYRILSKTDVVWNALHGHYGESGEVQKLFHELRVPFTGSGITPSLLSHDKEHAKNLYRFYGIPTPESTVLSEFDDIDDKLIEIFRNYLHPVIVKPATGVRGVGVALAHGFYELKEAVKRCFNHAPKVMVEEYVRGTVSTCAVVENAKGQDLYALLPTHFETEYRRVRPTPEENKRIEAFAKQAHQALGLRHYSSSDFVVTPKGKIYILETNSQPLFHEDSPLHTSLAASGWRPHDFAEHCVKLALKKI